MPRRAIWPGLRLPTKGLLVIAVPAAATLLIACASYILGARTRTTQQAVARGVRTSLQIQALRTDQLQAGAQVRAYYLTGDENFANQARQALIAFDIALNQLSELAAGDASQSRRVSQIAAFQRWRVQQILTVTARFQSGTLPPEALRASIWADEAQRVSSNSILDAIETQQNRSLDVQSRDVERLRITTRITTSICVFFGVLGGVAVSLLFASGITSAALSAAVVPLPQYLASKPKQIEEARACRAAAAHAEVRIAEQLESLLRFVAP